MGLARLELATSRLSGVRSNQLSYRPQPPGHFRFQGASRSLKSEYHLPNPELSSPLRYDLLALTLVSPTVSRRETP